MMTSLDGKNGERIKLIRRKGSSKNLQRVRDWNESVCEKEYVKIKKFGLLQGGETAGDKRQRQA